MFNWLINTVNASQGAALSLTLLTQGLILGILYYVLERFLVESVIHRIIRKTDNKWDDAFMHAKLFPRVLQIMFFGAFYLATVGQTGDAIIPTVWILRIVHALIILAIVRAIESLLTAVRLVYEQLPFAKNKPIRPYLQAVIILLYAFATIFVIATLIDKSPWKMCAALGGLTAILLLVFKDTILGLVAGIQLSAHDMVRVGDWIEMPKYEADGDVLDVTINTVKVQNWDKTITTIPTYALIADSFKNWRGMSESGGRRIKRCIHLDMNTVRFADAAMLESFRKMELLKKYVDEKQQEIDSDNQSKGIDLSGPVVNGRRQTNLGIFRAYLCEYLKAHPKIHKDMTFLVRHLQPTPQGLPLEIYVFSNDQVWANYEAIQADLFDHILAALPAFGLRVFQQPTGADFQQFCAK
jgi:miniconductance mechanosensitive channel